MTILKSDSKEAIANNENSRLKLELKEANRKILRLSLRVESLEFRCARRGIKDEEG